MDTRTNTASKILIGDTLGVLKTMDSDFVDLTVTSPPYNKKEVNKGWFAKNVKYDVHNDALPEDEYQKNQTDVLNELFRVTKEGGSVFYNHKIRWVKGVMIHPMQWLVGTDWTVRQEIVWDRTTAVNIRGWRFWQVEERIYWLYKPIGNNKIGTELLSKHALLTSIWKFHPETDNEHPAPFPITLPIRCIHSIMDERPGIVLDPYCGSGTSLLAAKLLGKEYIGIDNSKEYIEYANKRLDKPSERDTLHAKEELERHVVKKSFKERKKAGEWKNPIRGRKKVA